MTKLSEVQDVVWQQKLEIAELKAEIKGTKQGRREQEKNKKILLKQQEESNYWIRKKKMEPVKIIIRPEQMHKDGSSEETKRELTQYIRPNEKNIKIYKIIKTNSHAITIEMSNEQQAGRLEQEISNKEVKMKFDRLQKRNPKITVYGVTAEIGKEEFLEIKNIYNQNLSEDFHLDKHEKDTKICFETR
ncbi:hypothetical protein PR048_030440 [Dryococelus australis]|uniref:Uncharacterized protein n=1 Tax=Dryococelus australis TaxID=614101 RepID=A0ABQ9G8Z9_9NEOP|nr:hypothetical protein PR048_030440 [Dryococelus australis]